MKTKKSEKNCFKNIIESENILKYCFMLHQAENIPSIRFGASIDEIRNWIDISFKATDTNCYCFCLPNHSFFERITNENSTLIRHQDFSLLDFEKPFWQFMFKQHAILSAYDKTRKLLAQKKPISTSTFGDVLSMHFSDNDISPQTKLGLDYILNNPNLFMVSFDTLKISKHKPDKDLFYDDNPRSKTGNAINKSTKLFNTLTTNYNTSFLSSTDQDLQNYKELLQLNNFEFYQYASGTRSTDGTICNIKPFIVSTDTIFGKKRYTQYYETYNKIIGSLLIPGLYSSTSDPFFNDAHLNLVDKLYCRYLFEMVFCTSTIDCLYQNISGSADSRYIVGQLDIISKIFLLPNAFSRHYILQMAIDNLQYDFNNNLKFSDNDSRIGMLVNKRFSQESMLYNKQNIWLERYNTMIDLLQKLIFPIYENYFFVTVWKSIRPHCNSNDQCLEEMFLLLGKYLNDPNIVHELLSMHEMFIYPSSNRELIASRFVRSFDVCNLIEPFNHDKITDYSLYKECILATKNNKDINNVIPTFLQLEYLDSIQPELKASIQKLIYNCISSPN